jgi:Zn-dependent protease
MNFLADTPRFEIGRLAGIPVRVDITFALVPIFLFGILQQAPFEIAGPAYATIIAGVFLSVLLHELGHASVARLLGVPVGEILVGGFYGYARLLETPRSTAANVAILFAGPLANGVLFLIFWNLLGCPAITPRGYFGPHDPVPAIADSPWLLHAASTLARVNLAMLIFNLLPAFPLDGGRIYRDLLASLTSRASAAKIIAGLGVIVGAWSALIGLRIDVVLLLIGAEIAILNWAILKSPADADQF